MIDEILDTVDKNITSSEVMSFMDNIHRLNPLMMANKEVMDKLISEIRTIDSISSFVCKNISELSTNKRDIYLDMSLYLINYYSHFDVLYKDVRKIYFTDSSLTELIRDNEILHPLVICNLYHKNKYCIYKGK